MPKMINVLLCSLVLWAAPAWAIPITFDFTGPKQPSWLPFSLVGSLTFDSEPAKTTILPAGQNDQWETYEFSGPAYGINATLTGDSFSVSLDLKGSITVSVYDYYLSMTRYVFDSRGPA